MVNKTWQADLGAVEIDVFQGFIDHWRLSAFQYGRGDDIRGNTLVNRTTVETAIQKSDAGHIFGFTRTYRDNELGDVVLRIRVFKLKAAEFNLSISWNTEAADIFAGNLIYIVCKNFHIELPERLIAEQPEPSGHDNSETPDSREPWYQQLSPLDRQHYDWLLPHRAHWQNGDITDGDIAEKNGVSVDTIRRWRRELRRRGAPDMDWDR